jgi:hypothetical protein
LKAFSDELKTKEEFSTSEGDRDVNKKKNRYKVMCTFLITQIISCFAPVAVEEVWDFFRVRVCWANTADPSILTDEYLYLI